MSIKKLWVIALSGLCLPLFASQTMQALDEAFARGEIDRNEQILNKFHAMFEPELIDARFRPAEPEILRCGTPLIIEYNEHSNELDEATIAIIEDYLAPNPELREIFISPGGHFSFNYSTTGTNSVPSADTDASGVPDYVEWAAEYMDYTWTQEVDAAGFAGPNHTGGDGYYNISFESMSSYGYTTLGGVDGNELTRIVLHNTFYGFGSNQDPEGNQKGAMKVTCAHEFKHASQRVHSYWSEGGWVELDATWAEEFVYDYVNDSMLNFMGYGDPLSHPHWSLAHGGAGSYEDYPWEDFIHQRFDANSYTEAPVILDFWEWRETHTGQAVLSSYDAILQNNGTSLTEAFKEYVVWNFFTGSRAVADGDVSYFGYDEAGITGFPTASLYTSHNIYAVTANAPGIENLACRMIRLNPGDDEGLEIFFDGQNNAQMSAMWAVWNQDYVVEWGEIELDNNNDGSVEIDMRDAVMAALIPVVTQTTGSNFSASYTIENTSFTVCDPGDLNDDNNQDVSDLVRLVNVILGNGEPPNDMELCAGDVNLDDQINVQDVIALVDIILQ